MFNDLEKYRLLVTLLIAKFESEKNAEVQEFKIVNKLISDIIKTDIKDETIKSIISTYINRDLPNDIFDAILEDTTQILSNICKNMSAKFLSLIFLKELFRSC